MESQADGMSSTTTAVSPFAGSSQQEEDLLRALARAEAGLDTESDTPPAGDEYLLVWLQSTPCLVLLNQLREVLPSIPQHIALPFSPQWMWGIFPLRTELVALVDPWPILSGLSDTESLADARFHADEAMRALVIGEDDHLLGLLVSQVGAIFVLNAEERIEPGRDQAAGVLPHYVTGSFSLEGVERLALCLDVSRLANDVLSAIEEQPAHE